MEVGFEMVLARVECFHLLELLEKDQLGTQEWLEVLQRRAGHRKPEEPAGKKEEANRREVTTYLDTRLSEHPQPKPRSSNVMSVDQSIMEMQRTYPDLVFRGRPLVPDKPHQANSSKGVHTAVDDSKGAELAKRDSVTGTRAAALTVCSKADNMFGENSQICNDDFITTGSVIQGIAISSSTDGSGADELSGPQAISLHITLRTGSKAEKSPKPREPQPTAEPPGRRQQQTAADALNKSLAKAEPSSLSSVDEEQELRELAQRMGQLHVHEFKEEAKRKEEHKKGGENTNKERRLKWRKPRTEEDPEQQNFRKPVMETGGELSHDAGRHSRSSQSDHTVTEQNQPNMYHPSAVAVTTADCESCKGEGGTGQHEGEDPGRVDAGQRQDQLAHSFVIVEPHKK
ncbi:uncharacterized protein LOC113158681 [Anabas testudineus]|uniref:uncharacterized protein LOC113158681 n=1 Tax=Anabas testudineus TaxID=64144 RepID=UPI000E45685B|nr:uncharacterized protein LOC113158681 [Anabas testudineus]